MPHLNVNVGDLSAQGPILPVQFTFASSLVQTLIAAGNPLPDNRVTATAMIDTGATRTVVNPAIVNSLNLQPVGQVQINTPSSTNVNCYEYAIRMIFSNNLATPDLVVIGAPLSGQHIQCLIGRDLLALGTLYYNGTNNSFTLSF